MKFFKRFLILILILTTIGLIFGGWLYRQFMTYKSIGIRSNYSAKDKTLTNFIDANSERTLDNDIKQIIVLGLSLTSKQLNFSTQKNERDPNKLMHSKSAHCVGYATFFATSCNYLFNKNKLSDTWIARHRVGKLYFLGKNIHQYVNSPFFRDHDFVTIENKKTGEVIAVDPTVHDYLKIEFITYAR